MRRVKRQKRIMVLVMFLALFTLALGGRLFWLQYIQAEEFARAALMQRSLRYVYSTGRGQILDRNRQSLLDTRREPVLVSFAPISTEDTRQVLISEGWEQENPVHVIRGLNEQTIARFQQNAYPGLVVAYEELRYGENILAEHIAGTILPQEITRTRPRYIELSYRGTSGLERSFNAELSGNRPATIAAIIDGQGRLVEGLGYRHWQDSDPRRPYDLVTTIDSSIQAVVEKVGGSLIDSGAIVVLDPRSGDLLAMASFPGIKQTFLGISAQEYRQMVNDPRKPFINKAIQSYLPGSVFKVILAAAALERNDIDVTEHYTCAGFIEVGDRNFACFNQTAHGDVDLDRALAVSCNAYFIRLGQLLGREAVTEMAKRFKLGRKTAIPLGGQAAGIIPQPADMPSLGNLANTSIGQGDVKTTPLQLARMISIIVNDGRDIYPRLVSEITDRQGRTVKRYPIGYGRQIISPSVARRLKPMLANVVESGTARSAGSPHFAAAGKSGTAELTRGGPTHSWFAGYATANRQTYVITVFVEKLPADAPRASEVFREVTEAIFTISQ